jgi:hypothetical protein
MSSRESGDWQEQVEFLRGQLTAAWEHYDKDRSAENKQVYLEALRRFSDAVMSATWFR